MRTGTKVLAWGAVATAVLGADLTIGTGVSVAGGGGTFLGGALQDMLPAFVDNFRGYEPGTPGILGETPVAPAEPVAPTG